MLIRQKDSEGKVFRVMYCFINTEVILMYGCKHLIVGAIVANFKHHRPQGSNLPPFECEAEALSNELPGWQVLRENSLFIHWKP